MADSPVSSAADPICSICIANFNGIGVIEACLRSVFDQDCGFPVEVIVHDDASTDASVEFVRRNYPQVVVIASQENVGFCVANNRMAAAARGQYLLLLNNDAELFPDALRTLHAAAVQMARPCVLGLPQYDASTGMLIDMGSDLDPFFNPIPNLHARERDVGMIIGACLWIPQTLWRELGGFPEWLHTLAEDMFLCAYARLKGYPVRALSESGFRHWIGRSLGGGKVVSNRLATSLVRRRLSERNKSCVIAVCLPAPWMQLLLPLHVALLLVEGIALAAIKREPAILNEIYWGAIRGVWRMRATLAEARRSVQRNRTIGAAQFFAPVRWFPHKIRLLANHGLPEIR